MKMSDKVYIFQSGSAVLEVVLTGRTAKKKRGQREIVLHEIASTDKDMEFKTWVKLEQLYTIEE